METRDEYGYLHSFNDQPAITNGGDKQWLKHGKLHRDNDLPAVECDDGSRYYYKSGNLHRDNDLPAVINTIKGYEERWYNGSLHSTEHPTIIHKSKFTEYYWHGKGVTFDEWVALSNIPEEHATEIKLTYECY